MRTRAGIVATAPLVLIDLVTDAGVIGRSYVFTYTPLALTAATLEMLVHWAGPSDSSSCASDLTYHGGKIHIAALLTLPPISGRLPAPGWLKGEHEAVVLVLCPTSVCGPDSGAIKPKLAAGAVTVMAEDTALSTARRRLWGLHLCLNVMWT